MKQGDVVYQTVVQVANWLKPLIENKQCEVEKNDVGVTFSMERGSAAIVVEVLEHPRIADEAIVLVKGSLAKLPEDGFDPGILLHLLRINASLPGFSVALLSNNMLILRGALIGSSMDSGEFSFLLQALAECADELDDELKAALAGGQAASGADTGTAAQGQSVEQKAERFGQLVDLVVETIDARQGDLISAYYKKLSAAHQAEFDVLLQDEAFVKAVKTIVLGKPAGIIAAAVMAPDVSDSEAYEVIKGVLKQLPDHPVLIQLLLQVASAAAMSLGEALKLDTDAIVKRLEKLFA